MSDVYITLPPPAKFLDGFTKKPIKVQDEAGKMIDHPDRPFDWYMQVYVLSHLQFSVEVGGHDATTSSRQIERAMDKAISDEAAFFTVSANNYRRLQCCIARAQDKYADEPLKEKPNPRILAKSSQGMVRKMDNFTAKCFSDHTDAIANASTKMPEPESLPPAEEAQAPVPEASAEAI